MFAIVALVVIVVALVVGIVVIALRPRQDEGMQSFRRHIDALSPEARREVQERARRHEEGRG